MKKKFKNKSGMTLMEMMIAIAIFTISMEGFTLLFMRTWRVNSYALEMGQSSMAVSQGMNKMVGHIRGTRQADNGAYPIVSANDNSLVLYSDYDNDETTERLHFYKSGEDILMGVTDPTSSMPRTYPAGDEEIVTIASNIVNEPDDPIFSYYNRDYPGDIAHNPLSTPAAIANIRLVKIHLMINIDPNRAPDNIEMQSFAEMRNLNDW